MVAVCGEQRENTTTAAYQQTTTKPTKPNHESDDESNNTNKPNTASNKSPPNSNSNSKGLHVRKLSGTEFRRMLRAGEEVPEWFAFKSVVEVLRRHASARPDSPPPRR